MIITATPFRIGFVGGGSDLEAFYRQHGGAVLSVTINKYMYISTHGFFHPDQIRVKYALTETVDEVDSIKHPIIREVLKLLGIPSGLEISSNADAPSGSGLGSSSSFTVGLFHNLYTRLGTRVTKELLAEQACRMEIDILKEPIGKQDQYAAAFGGMNVLTFNRDGTVGVTPVQLPGAVESLMQDSLCMYYYGSQRMASSVLTEQKANMQQGSTTDELVRMADLVGDAKQALLDGNMQRFGRILHENWTLKRKLASKVSAPRIDEVYALALRNGAIGGKLLGAGGGGFFLFVCEKGAQPKLDESLRPLRRFPFRLESQGSRVIYAGNE